MPTSPVPPRDPFGERLPGTLLSQAGRWALVHGTGTVLVRYAARYLGRPHLGIVPGLIALDYGDFITGHAAWEFLTKRSNLYPRADVIGFRHDGADEMTLVKHLDLALTPMVLAYADEADTLPVAEISAWVAPPDADASPYLAAYLPRFDSAADWRAHLPEDDPTEAP